MRWIDKAGGFDAYIYHTPEKKLQSKLGVSLKQRMVEVVEKFDLTPPPRVVRLPRPPRNMEKWMPNSTTTTDSNSNGIEINSNNGSLN